MASTVETVRLDIGDMLKRFEALGPLLAPTVFAAMLVSTEKMLTDVKKTRMSNPRRGSTDRNLGVDTNEARSSMTSLVRRAADSIVGLIGSPVNHVKVHEEGFSGIVRVPSHTSQHRHGRTLAVSAKTGAATKRAALTRRQKRRGSWTVKAHDRKMKIIAKHFIRDTVIEAKEPTEDRILRALQIAFKTGRAPNTGQLGL